MLIAALVVLGIFSYRGLGVDLYPNVDIPTVTVTTTLKGSSVEEMETAVTKPIEDTIGTIDGIDELRAVIKDGISIITVQFILEKSADVAAQEVRDKVSTILSQLPTGTDPPVIQKFQVDAMPVMKIAVSGKRNLRELSEIARKQIKEDIESLRGVGQVIMVGRQERAVTIDVDPDRLAAYNLSIAQVKRAVQAENIEVPGGRIDQGRRELVLRTMGRMPTAADFNDLIVGNFQGRPILIRDIGAAENGVVEQRSLARLDGEHALQLGVVRGSEIAPDPRRAAGGVHGVPVHARLAQHDHRLDRHPGIHHRHVHADADHGLHTQQYHDAGVDPLGRHRHRRRRRCAGEHLSPYRGARRDAAERRVQSDA